MNTYSSTSVTTPFRPEPWEDLQLALAELRASVLELEVGIGHARPQPFQFRVIEGGGRHSADSPRPLLAVVTPD